MQVEAKEEERQFDSFVDSLGHADLFGKLAKTDAELKDATICLLPSKLRFLGSKDWKTNKTNQQLVKRVADMVSRTN
jgi:hypothetical protein